MSNLGRQKRRILQRHNAHKHLSPFYDDFVSSVQYGLNRLFGVPAADRSALRKRTISGMLNDFIVEDAIRKFDGSEGWKINQDFDGAFFVYRSIAALRFKKVERSADGVLYPSNVETDRQGHIQYQEELEGIETPTYVNIGYRLNAVSTAVIGLSLSCLRGTSQLWEIPIATDMEAYLFDNNGNATPHARAGVRSTLRRDKSDDNA